MRTQDGQLVTFSEVVGMTELNDGKPRRIRNCKARALSCKLYGARNFAGGAPRPVVCASWSLIAAVGSKLCMLHSGMGECRPAHDV